MKRPAHQTHLAKRSCSLKPKIFRHAVLCKESSAPCRTSDGQTLCRSRRLRQFLSSSESRIWSLTSYPGFPAQCWWNRATHRQWFNCESLVRALQHPLKRQAYILSDHPQTGRVKTEIVTSHQQSKKSKRPGTNWKVDKSPVSMVFPLNFIANFTSLSFSTGSKVNFQKTSEMQSSPPSIKTREINHPALNRW